MASFTSQLGNLHLCLITPQPSVILVAESLPSFLFKTKITTSCFSFGRISSFSTRCHTKSLFPRTHMRDSQLSQLLLLSPNLTTHAKVNQWNCLISISTQPSLHGKETEWGFLFYCIYISTKHYSYFIYASVKTSCLTRLCSKNQSEFQYCQDWFFIF